MQFSCLHLDVHYVLLLFVYVRIYLYICMCECVSVCLYFFATTVWWNKMNIQTNNENKTCVECENHRARPNRREPCGPPSETARCAEKLHQRAKTSNCGADRTPTGHIRLAHLAYSDSRVLRTGAVLGRQNTSSEQPPAQYGRR